MKSQHDSIKPSIPSVFRDALKNEGLRGLFKGVASPAVTFGFINATLFYSYSSALLSFEGYGKVEKAYLAGCIAGIPASIITGPSELIKCRAQMNLTNRGYFRDEYKIFLDLLRTGQIFRGLGVTMLRDVHSYGIYFSSYEYLNSLIEMNPTIRSLITGGLAGMLSWTTSYPVDVVKTAWQTGTSTNLKQVVVNLYKTYGISCFFRGYSATMLKAWPQHAVVFSMYEILTDMM